MNERGFCARCHSVGSVGEWCSTPGCRAEGMAMLPREVYVGVREGDKNFSFPWVGKRFDRVLTLEGLGRGAFGRLYRGKHLPTGMSVAVKGPGRTEICPGLSPADQLRNEALCLSRVRHPHIVGMLDYVPDDSEPVLILELIEEHDTLLDLAAEAQRTRRPFSAKHAWQILEQLFDALEHCHHRGVLHLDLNPSNIVIRSIEGNPRFVQLLDFGLARQSESQEPPPPAGAATSIAPEVLTGEVPDERADVYGAGLLACMLLLWQSPFHGQNQEQILAHKRGREGSSFDLLPSIDTPFEEALRRSLSVGPSGRTRTIAHLRAELGAAMKT